MVVPKKKLIPQGVLQEVLRHQLTGYLIEKADPKHDIYAAEDAEDFFSRAIGSKILKIDDLRVRDNIGRFAELKVTIYGFLDPVMVSSFDAFRELQVPKPMLDDAEVSLGAQMFQGKTFNDRFGIQYSWNFLGEKPVKELISR